MELRHLRYFTAVVRYSGYREASRQLHVAQPAISQTVVNLEQELGLRLFHRIGRSVKLTREGEIFYPEAIRTLDQAESAIAIAKRAARGDINMLRLGYWGLATHAFLPELIRKFKALYPCVTLTLEELDPLQQQLAFNRSAIDIGFTIATEAELGARFASFPLSRDPMLAVLPVSMPLHSKYVCVADLDKQPFILFHKDGAPDLFSAITRWCNNAGFAPNVVYEPNLMQTVVSLVEAEEGVSIVPACVLSQESPGVCFYSLESDDLYTELRAVWRKEAVSVALGSFLDLLSVNTEGIQEKAAFLGPDRVHFPQTQHRLSDSTEYGLTSMPC